MVAHRKFRGRDSGKFCACYDAAMRSIVAALCLTAGFGAIVAAPGLAADAQVGARWRGNMQFHSLPFPRSERAAAIWDERACWSGCGAHTAWGLAACVMYDAQGRCLRLADKADRLCQRQCRMRGGPLVSGLFND
jgi:hypothetical protein